MKSTTDQWRSKKGGNQTRTKIKIFESFLINFTIEKLILSSVSFIFLKQPLTPRLSILILQ